MKKLTKTLTLAIALALSQALHAQQWSDVGNQGFTPNPFGTTENSPDMAIYGNTLYMAYINTSSQVIVMKYGAGVWTALPTVATSGFKPDMAFDNSGTPYIVYENSGASNVKKFDGTNWVLVGSASINNTLGITGGLTPRISFDPVSNTPYIVFVDATNSVNVAKFNGTAWVVVGQQDFHAGTFPRMAISSTGVPYVVSRSNTGNISVSKFDGSNWVAVGPAGFASVAYFYTDIAIDAAGVPYVVSTEFTTTYKNSVLKFNGTAWVNVGAAGFTPGDVRYAQIKFNSAGVLHLVYSNAANGTRANLMKFDGTNWVAVGSTNFSSGLANTPSLGFDVSNTPYVGFGDASFTNGATVMKLCSSSTATINSTTPGNACDAGTVTLSATANTSSIKWYGLTGNQLGTGASYVTPSISTTTTYQVAAYDGNGCSSARSSVVATVAATPTVLSTQSAGTCEGMTAHISATVSAGNVSWYTTQTGGVAFATGVLNGSSVTTPVVNTTTTFYAEAVNNGCASTSRMGAQAIVNPTPPAPTANAGSRCGPGTVNISVTANPGTVQWFASSNGASALGTGTSFTTPSITTNTTYYALLTGVEGCPALSRTPVAASVKTIPTITSSTPANRCGDGSVNLVVTSSGDSDAQWFTSASGGSVIFTGKTFPIPPISTTTTYYAEAIEFGCLSTSRTAVIATIKPIPTITSADVSRCDAGTVTFEATSPGLVSWYAVVTGGSSLGTGANFTTPILNSTTPYFIEAVLNGCTSSPRMQVSGIVNTTPAQPTITQNNSNIEGPVLTSSATSGNQWFKNDIAITGETHVTYIIADQGDYKVQATVNGCVSPFSSSVSYVITGFEVDDNDILKLYPNPVVDELTVSLKNFEHNRIVNISILDLIGRSFNESVGLGGDEIKLNVRHLSQGQYIVLVRQGNRKTGKPFIKSL